MTNNAPRINRTIVIFKFMSTISRQTPQEKYRSSVGVRSETYDRQFKSVFAMQDEIAAAVVVALKITPPCLG